MEPVGRFSSPGDPLLWLSQHAATPFFLDPLMLGVSTLREVHLLVGLALKERSPGLAANLSPQMR